jgi:hypothetical protein
VKALLILLALAGVAHAETRRVAVVVGNNSGGADEKPLHFAETDAGKLARVLAELGGVRPEDLFLVQGKGLAALTETFNAAKQRIAAYEKEPGTRVILVFYFSGHSDGQALELGGDRLAYGELRRWLATTGADVRLALVDSCKSGALLAAKGGTRGPAFQIRLTEDLASSGEVLLTSSAADEVALESREIGGSFFTHHFVSGLRGAADTSGDGIVTLDEAYQYAYAHTIAATGETVIGPQHPAYDYRLAGQGELVLTELSRPTAAIELPRGFDRALITELSRDQVIAELTTDTRPVIAVQPGRYGIRARHDGKLVGGRITVAANEKRVVRWDELTAAEALPTRKKGPDDLVVDRAPEVVIGGGIATGVADALGPMAGMRAELWLPANITVALLASTKQAESFRETSTALLVGYRRGVERGPLSAWAGVEAGPGLIIQTPSMRPAAYSGALLAAPLVGASLGVADHVSIAAEVAVPAALLRRDGATTAVLLPAAWLGLRVAL